MKLKRYWVFVYDLYDPSGGMGDFKESLNDIPSNEFMMKQPKLHDEYGEGYVEIYDSKKNKIVKCMAFNAGDFEFIGEGE